ncbi:related to Sucrose-6-phosphate hydrolase [Melanopsichium pennsylvanicum]|uniref:Related to Sucrose-6-phosphate hydrolase n=2 Tax=Melanopsichium pennsylvanicum TaxID=63383 RepID=A0AAJ4XQS3_9BASI|nr:related to Sucrose-6-phosphate hydrolase [Melanopsichium pennsylvanicum 4]SNX86785.1 related to Sucrose-6-phosphate hydrolase [Melanopsichium pennsylvanicum]
MRVILTTALSAGSLTAAALATLAWSSPVVSPFGEVIYATLASNTTSPIPDFTAPPLSNISLYANNSLFSHWRPKAHFIHPSQQLGDPTAFWQSPNGTSYITALYSYLRGTENSSLSTSGFSGATTSDFVTYNDISGWENNVQMGPGNQVDFVADFDGSVVAHGYQGLPTLIWTSVKGLPISWTIPYKDGFESQALAYSKDNGTTWIKLNGGANHPVIPRPPYQGNVVTGFRDPYIFSNGAFDELFNVTSGEEGEKMHYLTLSSGLHPAKPGLPGVKFSEAGPRVWLYRQSYPGDWLNWTFCGPLLGSRINTTWVTPGSGWAATDYSDGNNYETSQISSLSFTGDSSKQGTGMAFMSYGAESNHTLILYRLGHWISSAGIDTNPINAALAPGVVGSQHGVKLKTALEGVLDWGLAYACTGLRDEKQGKGARRICYCWIKEAFASQDQTKFVQGWISSLTLPRELYVKKIKGVVNNELILRNASWAILNTTTSSSGDDGGGKIKTIPVEEFTRASKSQNETKKTVDLVVLGIRPATELLAFRTQANDTYTLETSSPIILSPSNFTSQSSSNNVSQSTQLQVQIRRGVASGNADTLVDEVYVALPKHPGSKHFELSATLSFPPSSLRNTSLMPFAAGVSILHRQNQTIPEDVAIVYQPANESIIVQKRTALGTDSISTTPEIGKLRLWQLSSYNNYNTEENKLQDLDMRIFVDGSALEVYINDVFALTTRAYYWYQDSTDIGLVYQIPHNNTSKNNNSTMSNDGDQHSFQVKWSNVTWWEGLVDAYPDRPKDLNQLVTDRIGYPEPTNNPNAQGIIYNSSGPAPPFPNLG